VVAAALSGSLVAATATPAQAAEGGCPYGALCIYTGAYYSGNGRAYFGCDYYVNLAGTVYSNNVSSIVHNKGYYSVAFFWDQAAPFAQLNQHSYGYRANLANDPLYGGSWDNRIDTLYVGGC
jgi:hypothetical protein